MKRLTLKPKEDRRLLRGHLWVYRNEIESQPDLNDGDLVDVYADKGRFVGRGFYQAEGGIAARLLERRQNPIDAEFIRERIGEALALRCRAFPGDEAYRWVHAESDGLPGLVADRYGSVVVCETSCAFYAAWQEELSSAFKATDGIEAVRIATPRGVVDHGEVPERHAFRMDSLQWAVDLARGQKTGMFLDQRVNSREIAPLLKGARVLDGHCYAGLWGCRAAAAGALEVLGVDTSPQALTLAEANARANGVEGVCRFQRADIAEVLSSGGSYDCVLLDPPALAKSRTQANKGLRFYQGLGAAAMQAISPGGLLVVSSCSHFLLRDALAEALKRASSDVRRRAVVLGTYGAPADHPVLLSMPETEYLTCMVLRIL